MTSRRGFLGALAGAIASAKLDPERALWVPGKRKIFIPPLCSGNVFLTPEIISQELLHILRSKLDIMRTVNGNYEREFARAHKVGFAIQVRRPRRFNA